MNVAIISFQDNSDIIGAKYIHAFLQSHNHKSYLILQSDVNCDSDEAIFKFISQEKIDLVGISIMSNEFFRACQFAKEFKARFGHIPLVFGGIHATIAPEECLAICDIAVRGEGEHIFLELIRCIGENIDYSNISGICIKHGDKIISNPPWPLEKNIDSFPFPKHLPNDMYCVSKGAVVLVDRQVFTTISRYSGTFPNIITTRGCPFSCAYCCNSALKKFYDHYPVRKRSVDSVIAEIAEIYKEHQNCITLNIQDDCFLTYSTDWIREFSDKYMRLSTIPFVIRTTPRHINLENLALLKSAGMMMVMMGLQSGSDRINRDIFKRSISKESFLKAANIVHDLGVAAYYDVILDNPYEVEADTLQTLDVLLQIPKPFQLVMFSLCFYQGTELHAKAIAEGLIFIDPRADNYAQLRPTVVNKLISLTPTIPGRIIKFLMVHRDNALVQGGIRSRPSRWCKFRWP